MHPDFRYSIFALLVIALGVLPGVECVLAGGDSRPMPSNVPDLQPQRGRWTTLDDQTVPYKRRDRDSDWAMLRVQTVKSWQQAKPGVAKGDAESGNKVIQKGTGFFRTIRHRDRWWLLDPNGRLFLSAGVNTFRPAVIGEQEENYRKHFGGDAEWVSSEGARLQSWGFNTAGCWSNAELLRQHKSCLAYTIIRWPGWEAQVGPLTAFSIENRIGAPGPGSRKYEAGVMPVFHPAFASFVEKHAPALARYADDRNLIGYFLDNELPFPQLDSYLNASPTVLGHEGARDAAVAWLSSRGKTPGKFDHTDREAWAGYVFESYCAKVVVPIRKHDPHHLVLGPRLFSKALSSKSVLAAVGAACDVVSLHPYGITVPDTMQLDRWSEWAGKPIMITEWYAKAEDAPFRNVFGAGILVPTQHFRGLYYQGYVMSCLASTGCVGWHWHRYQDNDPEGREYMFSNRSENKGLVAVDFSAYESCVSQMREINEQMYAIASSHLPPEPEPSFDLRRVAIWSLLMFALGGLLVLLSRIFRVRKVTIAQAANC